MQRAPKPGDASRDLRAELGRLGLQLARGLLELATAGPVNCTADGKREETGQGNERDDGEGLSQPREQPQEQKDYTDDQNHQGHPGKGLTSLLPPLVAKHRFGHQLI